MINNYYYHTIPLAQHTKFLMLISAPWDSNISKHFKLSFCTALWRAVQLNLMKVFANIKSLGYAYFFFRIIIIIYLLITVIYYCYF